MSRRNIGVAVEVPEPFGRELQGWRERLGDPNATAIVPHVTLLAPTAVAPESLAAIEEHLLAVARAERPFEIELRGSATFRPVSPVVFVPLVRGISECERLEARIRSGPLARPTRFNYHPHVTVAHDLPDPALDRAYCELAGFSARFPVRGFSLFEQGGDGVWRPQRDVIFGSGGFPGPPERTVLAPEPAEYPDPREEDW
ncbi:MAG TPA: 2'-5' RNA ligase family protein [Mycobacteriales bacterium]|nr:2'-5' RNA ligase family protein [Mycobacteriales bacterium]